MNHHEPSNPVKKITAIVLASGLGSRFGGNKLLHPLQQQDQPLLSIGVLSALNAKPFVDHVICVVRPNDTELKQQFKQHGFTTVDNPDFEQGLSASIKAGVNACLQGNKELQDSHYLICLGDMPYITEDTYTSVIERFKKQIKTAPNVIVRPKLTTTNKPGHPVIFSHYFKSALLTLSGDDGGKPIIKQHGYDAIHVKDPGVLEDIDYKTDIH